MSRLKGALATTLWMALPVAAGALLLQVDRRGPDPAMLEASITGGTRSESSTQATGTDTPQARVGGVATDLPGLVVRRPDLPATLTDTCALASGTDSGIAVGDTISVRFFEDVAAAGEAPTTFERRDLAATLQVGRDGTVALPALGRVEVFGTDPACLEQDLARRSATRLGFRGRVGVTFAARPATLVRGDVLRPGSYAYDPALTPDRLVTLAGHLDSAGRIGAPEREALAAQTAELQATRLGLLLRIARLRAALDGKDALDLPTEARTEIAETLGPAAIETDTILLRDDLRSLQARRDIAAERAAQAEGRIARLSDTLAATEAELDYARARRERVSTLRRASPDLETDAEREILTLQRERLERVSALEDARTAADTARQDVQLAETAWRRERLEAARDSDLELTRIETRIAGLLARTDATGGEDRPTLSFTLERVTPTGTLRQEIDADAVVMPGDLVTVSTVEPTVAADATEASR